MNIRQENKISDEATTINYYLKIDELTRIKGLILQLLNNS